MKRKVLILGVAGLLVSGCASSQVRERGWLGGTWIPVETMHRAGPELQRFADVEAQEPSSAKALLLVDASKESPVRDAGLVPGDVILALNGKTVCDSSILVEDIRAQSPGAQITLSRLRDGKNEDIVAIVGIERYLRENRGLVFIGLSLSCDLWPFDDGIDIFGLVTAKVYDEPVHDGVQSDYAKQTAGENVSPVWNEPKSEFRVLPLGMSTSDVIVTRERYTAKP